jgi:ABC-type arginine transport system permease subunit
LYYGGRPEPVNPVAAAAGAVIGAVAGLIVGFFGFLLATFFPHLLRTALPGMTPAWFLALWIAALTVPLLALRGVLRGGRGLGTRVYAVTGMVAILALFLGEATGAVRVFPWQERFYLVPAIERGDTPAPVKR